MTLPLLPPPPPPPPPAPTPPPTATPVPRPRRRKAAWWDRVKILWLLALLFGFSVWRQLADNPLMSTHDALQRVVEGSRVLFVLGGLELVRQLHYLLSERSGRWHHLWTESIFGRWDRFVDRRNPWTRYRAGRAMKAIVALGIFGVVFGAVWDTTWYQAIFDAPSRIFDFLFSTTQQLPFVFQMVMILGIAMGQFVAIFWFLSRGGVEVYRPEEIKERFTDVKGQEPILAQVKEAVAFLEDPRPIEERGGRVPKGILLWGPPGTGKTLMAKAVAGETSRPFVFVEPAAFTNMFLGVGVLKVKSLYRKLRKLSLRYGSVIVFFDEADSLGNRGGAVAQSTPVPLPGTSRFDLGCSHWATPTAHRLLVAGAFPAPGPEPARAGGVRGMIMGMGGGGGGFGTVQALLTEMDGLEKPRGFLNRHVRRLLSMRPKPPLRYRMLHLMATNLPDALDPAFLRPGRIERVLNVARPTSVGREQTFRHYLGKITHVLTDDQIHRLAVITSNGTGASIEEIVNESLIVAIREGRDAVTYQDVIQAKHLKTHGAADDWTYSDWEGHAVAVHEACHAVAMYRLRKRDAIDIATIERRGGTGGFVAPIPLEDQFVEWRSEIESDVMTFLASLAGERLFFDGDSSLGVGGDLRSATAMVMQSMAYAGMGDTLASHGVTLGLLGRSVSGSVEDGTDRQLLETDLGRRVEAKLQELLQRVGGILRDDRAHVLAIAHALEEHKTITGEDIAAIVEGTEGILVDGASYHDPAVMAELETYHAAVVRAMHEFGRVEHPLPAVAARQLGPAPVPVAGSEAPAEQLPPPPPPPPPPPG